MERHRRPGASVYSMASSHLPSNPQSKPKEGLGSEAHSACICVFIHGVILFPISHGVSATSDSWHSGLTQRS